MSKLFLAVLKMSFTASYVILFVIIVRLLLKKAPKIFSYVLWSVVAFRLIVPFSFESLFSLLPRNAGLSPLSTEIVHVSRQNPQFKSGLEAADTIVNSSLNVPIANTISNPLQSFVELGAYIWVLGVIVLLVYSIVSVLLLKRQLQDVQQIGQNIYQADNLRTPFVLGLISPRVYLPAGLSKEEQDYILVHEQCHIRRKDHLIKILAFFIVSVHWFNPLVWVAFMLMSTDMELSCDEKVLQAMDDGIKKPYANSLLSLAGGRHILSGSPLAFGEGDVRGRIKNVLNYKKPKFWVVLISIIVVAAIGIGLAANPYPRAAALAGSSYHVKEILYQAPMYSFAYTLDMAPQFRISQDFCLFGKEITDEDWSMLGKLYRYEISEKELSALFPSPDDNVYEVIKKTKLIYRADKSDDIDRFYLVIQLKDGDVLLAVGYDNVEKPHIRWLFSLWQKNDYDNEAVDRDAAGIRWEAAADVPRPVRDFAADYVHEQVKYYNGLGYNTQDAKITGMTCINTGTAALTRDIQMWLLEYRLLPENPDKVILAGGMQLEDGWITEWGSTGQPLLVAVCDWDSETEIWRRIGATNTLWVQEEHQGDYTAATMALYYDFVLRTGITWGYMPARSSVFPALPVRIDMPFSSAHVMVDRGRLWRYNIDCGKEADYSAGELIFWSPSEGDEFGFGAAADGCLLHFEIIAEDGRVHKGTILVEQIKQAEGGVWFYSAALTHTDTGLLLVQNEEYNGGCILKLP